LVKVLSSGPKTGIYNYTDIDDNFISIHHFIKWYKFDFTRSFNNLSLEIRNGRLTREKAIGLLKEKGDETPHNDREQFCQFTGIQKDQFYEIIEKFQNGTPRASPGYHKIPVSAFGSAVVILQVTGGSITAKHPWHSSPGKPGVFCEVG